MENFIFCVVSCNYVRTKLPVSFQKNQQNISSRSFCIYNIYSNFNQRFEFEDTEN